MRKLLKILFIILNALLTAAVVLLLVNFADIKSLLISQKASQRWAGGSEIKYAQISAYQPLGGELSLSQLRGYETKVDAALEDASIENESSSGDAAKLWTYAYSAEAVLSVTNSSGTTADVSVTGVGGDFFLFHPLILLAGSYISSDDLMQDRVVIDEELAWKMFGSTNAEGMYLYIYGVPYYVAGVVDREDDFASKKAYGETGGGMFMSYSALESIQSASGTEPGISCYEAVIPNPISGFAMGIVQNTLSMPGDIVENSNRYTLGSLWGMVTEFGLRSVSTTGVGYPYWENAARVTEDYLALLLAFIVLFSILPAITITVIVIRYTVKGSRLLYRFAAAKTDAAVQARRTRRYEESLKLAEREKVKRSQPGEPLPAGAVRQPRQRRERAPEPEAGPEPPEPEDDELMFEIESVISEIIAESETEAAPGERDADE